MPLSRSLISAGVTLVLKGPPISTANLSPPTVRACRLPSTAASHRRGVGKEGKLDVGGSASKGDSNV